MKSMYYNIKVAVIGTGYMGKQYIDILKKMVESMVICTTDEKTGRELAESCGAKFYIDYQEMLEKEKPDFVAVCLPTHLHYPVAKLALEQGIHVMCEKPFTATVEQAEELTMLAEEKNLLLMVGHCVRFKKEYEYLKRCIQDERFGKLITLNLYRHSPRPNWSIGNWLEDVNTSGGVVKDLHIHDTDMIVNLLGMPKSVHTIGNETNCITLYRYPNGTTVTASGSWMLDSKFSFSSGFDAIFEKTYIRFDGVKLYQGAKNPMDEIPECELGKNLFNEFFSENFIRNELNYYCTCLVDKMTPELCHPKDSLKTMIANSAEITSLTSGTIINIDK